MTISPSKETVGWREWIHLPEFCSTKIKAKIDTGAKTSSIHADDIKIFTRGKKKYVRFTLLPTQKSKRKSKVIECEMLEKRKVRSSVGTETIRPVIRTLLRIGPFQYPIELTLVNRDIMGFRMLIGREALRGLFLVDPQKSFLVSKEYNKR